MYNELLIGKEIKVLSALDKSLISKNGLVVNETKNMLIVQSLNGNLFRLPKSVVTLNIYSAIDKKSLMIEGSKLIGTPDERIKG
ncbi:MAG TPA: ribonuclease P protein subunit [Nitrososphaerales archaeon]|nr:ribonuclease P protein subunit [Nitrososphaerales archaeon]